MQVYIELKTKTDESDEYILIKKNLNNNPHYTNPVDYSHLHKPCAHDPLPTLVNSLTFSQP